MIINIKKLNTAVLKILKIEFFLSLTITIFYAHKKKIGLIKIHTINVLS